MRPLVTPSWNTSGRRAATPGTPFGTLLNGAVSPKTFLPFGSSKRVGE